MNIPHELLRSLRRARDLLTVGRWFVAAWFAGTLVATAGVGQAGMIFSLSPNNAADGLLNENAVWLNEFANSTADRFSLPPSDLEPGTPPDEGPPIDEQENAPQEVTVLAIGRNSGGASNVPRNSGSSPEAGGILSNGIDLVLQWVVERLTVGRTPVLVSPVPDRLLDPPKFPVSCD